MTYLLTNLLYLPNYLTYLRLTFFAGGFNADEYSAELDDLNNKNKSRNGSSDRFPFYTTQLYKY